MPTNLAAVEGGAPATIAPALRGGYRRRLPLDLEVVDFG